MNKQKEKTAFLGLLLLIVWVKLRVMPSKTGIRKTSAAPAESGTGVLPPRAPGQRAPLWPQTEPNAVSLGRVFSLPLVSPSAPPQ